MCEFTMLDGFSRLSDSSPPGGCAVRLKGKITAPVEKEQHAREEARRITLTQWGDLYFSEMINPGLRSAAWQRILFNKLKASRLGEMFLDEIDEAVVDEYRDRRLRDPVTKFNGKDKQHKPVKGRRVAYSTVNRELAILRILLRLAKRKKRIKTVPEFNLQSEKPLKRNRVANDDEIARVLSNLARHWQRAVIGLLETAMRVQELLKLTWDKVDEKAGVIRLKAEDVKEEAPRVVPISPTLQAILNELKAERRKAKVTGLSSGFSFTTVNPSIPFGGRLNWRGTKRG